MIDATVYSRISGTVAQEASIKGETNPPESTLVQRIMAKRGVYCKELRHIKAPCLANCLKQISAKMLVEGSNSAAYL